MEPTTDSNRRLDNPLALDGLEFIEFVTHDFVALDKLFVQFGFQKIGQHKRKAVVLYRQNQINFVVNNEPGSFALKYLKQHGPSICGLGFRVRNAQRAFDLAVQKGGRAITGSSSKQDTLSHSFPAIYGVGNSAIYFVDRFRAPVHFDDDFRYLQPELQPKGRGLIAVDHLIASVPKGDLAKAVEFFQKVFNFHEIHHFDIKGQSTGLTVKTMRSPCRKITLPIHEPTEGKSQVQEFLDEHRGAGLQRIALTTLNIVNSVRALREHGIEFHEAPPADYYDELPARVPALGQDTVALRAAGILVDGTAPLDSSGYLLQIFSKNVLGPLHFEVIQRQDHSGFGAGNVQALFEAIERDQLRRGYI